VVDTNARLIYKTRATKLATKRLTPEQRAASGTEHGQQSALFMWAHDNIKWYPQLKLMHAIPNGGLRDRITAARLKAEGVKRGVPDVFLPAPIGEWHGLYIEMKRPDSVTKAGKRRRHGVEDDEQQAVKAGLMRAGYGVATCQTFQEARDLIVRYLTWKP
jgi:hypothetical protein